MYYLLLTCRIKIWPSTIFQIIFYIFSSLFSFIFNHLKLQKILLSKCVIFLHCQKRWFYLILTHESNGEVLIVTTILCIITCIYCSLILSVFRLLPDLFVGFFFNHILPREETCHNTHRTVYNIYMYFLKNYNITIRQLNCIKIGDTILNLPPQ